MNDYGRRIVVDWPFEAAIGALMHALREEGLHTIARVDVREHFRRDLGHDFRQYYVIEAWSPALALTALTHDLDAGAVLPTRLAVYELADGESAILATEPLAALMADAEWRRDAPALAALATEESERIARVLARLQRPVAAAA